MESIMAESIEQIANVAQDIIDKVNASDPEIRKIMKEVHSFIQKRRVLCYGGTAINNILPKKEQFYDFTVDIPDYDFFSEDPTRDSKDLANILANKGIQNVQVRPGVHLTTFKVFANFTGVADISFLDKHIFERLWKESIVKDDIHYVPPNFLRMSMYLELSRPRGDVSRWKKVYTRLSKLNAEYPLECNKLDIDFTEKTIDDDIRSKIEDTLKNPNVVLLGFNAFNIHGKKRQWALPIDILVLKEEVEKTVGGLQDMFNKSKVYEYPEYAELLPPHYEIVDSNEKLLVRAFETDACHSYHDTNTDIKLASIPTLLNFLFALLYSDRHFLQATTHNRLVCACQILVEMANDSKKRRFKLLTPIQCIGDQRDLRDMREERAELYEKLKSDRNSEEFLRNFFTYTPKVKRKFLGGNLSRMFPAKRGVDYTKLKMTAEGRYSITKPWDSDQIIKKMEETLGPLKNKTIADLTGNVGGDTIRFAMNFKHVDSYELDKENYEALENNVQVYDLKNVSLHHGDSTKLFTKHVDVVYLDAPWGGPDYKEKTNMDLFIGTERIDEYVEKIFENNRPSAVFLKVPNNYNFERINGTVMEVGKFKLICIKRNV
jgi:hypothetical protein